MRRPATIAAVLLAVTGCGHRAGKPCPPPDPPVTLPAGPRPVVSPDVSRLPAAPSPFPTRPPHARRLTAADCRALAAKAAPFADGLERPPDDPRHPWLAGLLPGAERSALGRLVRGHAADELRNRAAGDALDEFFKLARAEGQFDLLTAADAELRASLSAAEEAVRQGLRDRGDSDALRVRVLDQAAQAAELEAAIGSLNASLRARLGADARDPLPIGPADPLRVRAEDVDADEAVRTALHRRPDLNLLRVLSAEGGPAVEDLARAVLASISPLLAAAKSNPLLDILTPFARRPSKAGEAARCQVAEVLAARERQAEAEVRAAALTLRGHRAAATAKAAAVRRLEGEVGELEKRQAAGQGVTAELLRARLDLLKGRGELLQAAADWNAAEAKLRQAMGLLGRE